LSFDESFDIVEKWLHIYKDLEQLDFDLEPKINGCMINAVNKGHLPISLDNLKKESMTLNMDNRGPYNIIVDTAYMAFT
jgi:hypothetical protein